MNLMELLEESCENQVVYEACEYALTTCPTRHRKKLVKIAHNYIVERYGDSFTTYMWGTNGPDDELRRALGT